MSPPFLLTFLVFSSLQHPTPHALVLRRSAAPARPHVPPTDGAARAATRTAAPDGTAAARGAAAIAQMVRENVVGAHQLFGGTVGMVFASVFPQIR